MKTWQRRIRADCVYFALDMANPLMKDRLLNIHQVADRLNISTRSVRRLIAEGHFICAKIGGSLRIKASSVSSYLERQVSLYEYEHGISVSDDDNG